MTGNTNRENPIAIAQQFTSEDRISRIQPFGSGNINDTFLVTLDSPQERHFILQKINTQVFRQPQLVMENISTVTQHISHRLQNTNLNRHWKVLAVLVTHDNRNYYQDSNGSFWRGISFIANSQSFDIIKDTEQAKEIGYSLGTFHNLISDLSPAKLADTLPGFHITPLYLEQYHKVLGKTNPPQSTEVKYCLDFICDRSSGTQCHRAPLSHILETAKAEGKLPLRLMHGDPKINNVLFDITTNQAISIIDLDTVKPGLVHYDIGDCLRSGCNPVGEETQEWEKIRFEPDLCQGILQGYLSVAKAFLTENDYIYIYDAIRLIAFELGLRFFTDYLAGNIYFKVKYPEHNLVRALVQFKLTESIESQEKTIRSIINDFQISPNF
ncbi:MAG TPA: aminoglycoside phosphotransferase [Cyanobacteria bacterium UBA11149]|nr:aminoglycoside phosphotransferase [Cyanobacteria bacterium UBA11367]HBE57890.1 aminoglycoside phosphotransferase [Cyanobacteria bacterium UBA11366]HBK65641.1 aminoglycoside phosphotransferase [Cyanobacteria bacterium UBA11166]HBR74856.1 aminoglycoside phosphotransferase [Cyanobacteria bacterium UBA11159]HBS69062.1 aminoglycoside phosphotransferase [Cyanobacteria bacterium UBA11153]HBW90963.1 aminoglycoside phosphotransferase [Cyanobacteria bacterium UBA11149]HCA95042.1 aminoglycoside phosp